MERYDPRQPGALPHAGTFNNNVLSMAAGHAGLTEIFTPETADALFHRGEALRARLNALAGDAGMQWAGLGSLLTVHFLRGPIRSPVDAALGSAGLRELFFFDMLEHGFYLAPRGMVTLSLEIGDAEGDAFCAAVAEFVEARGGLLQ